MMSKSLFNVISKKVSTVQLPKVTYANTVDSCLSIEIQGNMTNMVYETVSHYINESMFPWNSIIVLPTKYDVDQFINVAASKKVTRYSPKLKELPNTMVVNYLYAEDAFKFAAKCGGAVGLCFCLNCDMTDFASDLIDSDPDYLGYFNVVKVDIPELPKTAFITPNAKLVAHPKQINDVETEVFGTFGDLLNALAPSVC